jgi:DNA-binding transcriptional regulator YdaS (Cro superfamily)
MKNKAFTLLEWIDLHFEGNQRTFAAAQGVQPPQVTQWAQKNFIVVNGQLYSPRRELKT